MHRIQPLRDAEVPENADRPAGRSARGILRDPLGTGMGAHLTRPIMERLSTP
jgi:hypothetical protein